MGVYGGVQALDAEMRLDFSKENLTVDYSLNKIAGYRSNYGAILNDEFKKLSFLKRSCEVVIHIILASIALIVLVILTPFSHLIKNQTFQYAWQRFLKYSMIHSSGITELSKSGKLYEPVLSFRIPRNMWFEYNLEGEYQEKIKSITLKRHLQTHYMFGEYKRLAQNGWDVIFEFDGVPQHGSCVLRHV